jgi:hypothetical protein
MGFGDKIRGAITGAIGADPITTALTPKAQAAQTGDFPRRPATAGHVTSGLDQAMRDHADRVHPVEKPIMGADWDK